MKNWWKARKVFKFPKILFDYGFQKVYFEEGVELSLKINGLDWKDKFGSPRHIESPKIHIGILLWNRMVIFNVILGTMDYWESLLWYLKYCKKYGCDRPIAYDAVNKYPRKDMYGNNTFCVNKLKNKVYEKSRRIAQLNELS